VSGHVFGLVSVALLSFGKVRKSVFYTAEIPPATPADKAADAGQCVADRPPE
jgi:hypothetical protein